MSKHDVIILGGGLSGLAAGIRLSQFGLDVVLFERHHVVGGLNSWYTRGGRTLDTGLHALTNIGRVGQRSDPMNVLLRQLRLRRDDFAICPQKRSTVYFPQCSLTFDNDEEHLAEQVAALFPGEAQRFRAFHRWMCQCDPFFADRTFHPAGEVLKEKLGEPLLRDLLSCPVMYYGNSREGDMDFRQFCIIYRSIFVEGLGRPAQGMKPVLDVLEGRLRENGCDLRLGCGIRAIHHQGARVTGVEDDRGEFHEGKVYLSCAGGPETGRLLDSEVPGLSDLVPGPISYVEMLYEADCDPAGCGFLDGIEFRYLRDSFAYRCPRSSMTNSGFLVCVPSNFEGVRSRSVRLSVQASSLVWSSYGREAYAQEKAWCSEVGLGWLDAIHPGSRGHLHLCDMYTPCTFTRFTGRLGGAIYGMSSKLWDGRTPLSNLWLCGADQGYLGIVGALLSGVTMANLRLKEGIN